MDEDGGVGVSPAELERERLRTYLDWAEVRAPAWYWPAVAAATAAMVGGLAFGTAGLVVGAAAVAVTALAGLRVIGRRGGLLLPRLRGMPRPLLASFAPAWACWLLVVAVLVLGLAGADLPYLALGPALGAAFALAGALGSWWYRRAAARLADEAAAR